MKLTEAQQHIFAVLCFAVDNSWDDKSEKKVQEFVNAQIQEHGSVDNALDAFGPKTEIFESFEYVLNLLKGPTAQVYTQSKPSPFKIEVVRYLRPTRSNHVSNKLGFHNNLHGITVVYEIDYATRLVQASFSICNGDNFSKAEGVQRAKEANQKVVFPLGNVYKFGDLKQAFLVAVGFSFGCEYDSTDYTDLVRHLRKVNQQIKSK